MENLDDPVVDDLGLHRIIDLVATPQFVAKTKLLESPFIVFFIFIMLSQREVEVHFRLIGEVFFIDHRRHDFDFFGSKLESLEIGETPVGFPE